jgi:hypothetical protein
MTHQAGQAAMRHAGFDYLMMKHQLTLPLLRRHY